MSAKKFTHWKQLFPIGFIVLLAFGRLNAAELEEDQSVGEFHYFSVTDPAGFIEAIDKHYDSECAENWQQTSGAIVLLGQLSGDQATHVIYVGYPNYRKMEEGRGLFRSCAETPAMLATISRTTNTNNYSNVIFEGVMAFNTESLQKYYVKTDVRIGTAMEAEYSKAFVAFLADYAAKDNVSPDLYANFVKKSHHGINRVLFGNKVASHYIYFGGTELDSLILNMKAMLSSEAYTSFNESVEDMRIVQNSALMEVIKAYPVERESK